MMNNSFINLDLSSNANINIVNFNLDKSKESLSKFDENLHIEITDIDKSMNVSISTISNESIDFLYNMINIAISNINASIKNKDELSFMYYQERRDNRKWYQFWLNESDDKLLKQVQIDKSWFSGKDYAIISHNMYYRLLEDLYKIKSIIEMKNYLSYDTVVSFKLKQNRFAQFLHYLNTDSNKHHPADIKRIQNEIKQ